MSNMETKRRQPAKVKRDPEGNIICSCGCGQRPVAPRKTWFSQACVDAWKEVNDTETIRRKILKRDGGICAVCQCDANKAYAAWTRAANEANRFIWHLSSADRRNFDWNPETGCMVWRRLPDLTLKEHRRRMAELKAKWMPPGNWTHGRTSGWDADHIIPVVEGGGMCGLENYRTLCHPCHKEATKALAARRAAARRKDHATQTDTVGAAFS